jgi:RimJ/RimL family protein N-acetyltransferase
LARRLAEPDSGRIWIGFRGRHPIGVVRVDRTADGACVVGIALDPAERGQGQSAALLEAGLAAARRAFPGGRFRAWIRPDNGASIALFESAGFESPASPPAASPSGAPAEAIVLERD